MPENPFCQNLLPDPISEMVKEACLLCKKEEI